MEFINLEIIEKGTDMANRFIAELEEAFSGLDDGTMFALAGGVLATALDGLSIKHGRDPEEVRELVLAIGPTADAAAKDVW